MAFDWTKVDGYKEDMTNDEKVALLEKFTMLPRSSSRKN